MSRKFTINGREVIGCMNYVYTPCPNLLVDEAKKLQVKLDSTAQAIGARMSLYLKADTYNTATPLRYYLHGLLPGAQAAEIAPAQAKNGCRIDLPARWDTGPDEIDVNCVNGSYTIRRLALMLTSEMDEIMQSEHPLDTDWSHWYPA